MQGATKVANIALVLAYSLFSPIALDDKKWVFENSPKLSVQLLLEDRYAIHTNNL
ncbi:MAG: hypothetical protein ACI9SK_002232 [Zhongshania sp.]|jgi:hypothetical protein